MGTYVHIQNIWICIYEYLFIILALYVKVVDLKCKYQNVLNNVDFVQKNSRVRVDHIGISHFDSQTQILRAQKYFEHNHKLKYHGDILNGGPKSLTVTDQLEPGTYRDDHQSFTAAVFTSCWF